MANAPLSISRIIGAKVTARPGRDVWISDDIGYRGVGRLVARISKTTVRFYYRHSASGNRRLIPIGPFSRTIVEGYFTLEMARSAARALSAKSPLGSLLQASKLIASGAQNQPEPAPAKTQQTDDPTLRELCAAYVTRLEADGKKSANQIRGQFRLHVESQPVADTPAHLVTSENISDLLRVLVARGVGSTAAQLRSHLHAAYQNATAAALDPSQPTAIAKFSRVRANPVAGVASLSKLRKSRSRSLSERELRAYLRYLHADPEDESLDAISRRAIRLNLYLASQRGAQLLSANRVDLLAEDSPCWTLTLFDPKGNRATPRIHVLPVERSARQQLQWFLDRSIKYASPRLFASADPRVQMRQNELSKASRRICRRMLASGVSVQSFQYNDLRRTAETLLAKLKVNDKVRGHLLSHGLSGVQDKVYNMWEYMEEKREALALWHDYLSSLEGDLGAAAPPQHP